MAAALAASLPSSILPSSLGGGGKDNSNQKKSQDNATSNSAQGQGQGAQGQGQGQGQGQAGQVPQRMEGLIDPEASKAVESVALGSLVSDQSGLLERSKGWFSLVWVECEYEK